MAKSLKVWLVEFGEPFERAGSREAAKIKKGIDQKLTRWFNKVLRDRDARREAPSGYGRRADVRWTEMNRSVAVGPRDLVIYFNPSAIPINGSAPQTVMSTHYRDAARSLKNRELKDAILGKREPMSNGGVTISGSVGSKNVPALSVVYVMYTKQMSNTSVRISQYVDMLSMIAFHEAAHNKGRATELHQKGGGGIFGDIHTGRGGVYEPNGKNYDYFAEYIWDEMPQYTIGGTLTPVG